MDPTCQRASRPPRLTLLGGLGGCSDRGVDVRGDVQDGVQAGDAQHPQHPLVGGGHGEHPGGAAQPLQPADDDPEAEPDAIAAAVLGRLVG